MKNNLLLLLFSFLITHGYSQDTIQVIKTIDSLIQVSRTLTGKREFDKALEINAIGTKMAEEKLGKYSLSYGNCCNNQGRILGIKGDFKTAEKWLEEALDIRAKILGKEHPDYATSLFLLANVCNGLGNYKKAEQACLESKMIRKKLLGEDHPDYMACLNLLGTLYQAMGDYDNSEGMFQDVNAIAKRVLGREHPDYLRYANNLAVLYKNIGKYEKAELIFIEVKEVRAKTLGNEHPNYATSLHNLGTLYYHMGNYERAEQMLVEAKNIRGKVLGKDHLEYGQSLNNLGALYVQMGNYEKAELIYLESGSIKEKKLGREHPEYALSLLNLADLYVKMGNNKKAISLAHEAKDIREKVLGKEHPDYGHSLNNLAVLYLASANFDSTEYFLREAKAVREKALGNNHPEYAETLNNFGLLYWQTGDYKKAEVYFNESTVINEKLLGNEHVEYVENIRNQALLYGQMGDSEKAVALFDELEERYKILIKKAFRYSSEQELNRYLTKFSENQDQLLSYAQTSSNNSIIELCLNDALFYKGFLLNATSYIKRLAYADSVALEKLNLLKSIGRRLAVEYSKPITERIGVTALEEKANDIEKELVRTVSGYGEALLQVNWQEIQQHLKPDEVALEFVDYHYYRKNLTDSTMYAALVLLPDNQKPLFVPLFEKKQIAGLLSKGDVISNTNQLYASRGIDPIEPKNLPSKDLYELIWKPLTPYLEGIKTIYYSPSGVLNQINLGAIPAETDATMADQYRLVQLGSTRQLSVPQKAIRSARTASLFGGIRYDLDTTTMNRQKEALNVDVALASHGEPGFANIDSTLRTGAWNYLPGTEKEVFEVEKLMMANGLQVQSHKAHSATEEAIKNIGFDGHPSPRILHLATHGFFFPNPRDNPGQKPLSGNDEPVFKSSDNPLIRSGLILAGGSHAWISGKPFKPGMEDGVLTAYEISQMDLNDTELVVLSACETGLGDIQGNEGVYGLQRAFKMAGARYLIMSLWQVPDLQTQELMTTFYTIWLSDKMSLPDAFQAAQKAMREKYEDPYLWAGFLLVQ